MGAGVLTHSRCPKATSSRSDKKMNRVKNLYKLAIIAPNCFYYQAEMFRQLANHPRIDLTVYFCSDEGLHSEDVSGLFGSDSDWGFGEDILQGYKSKFLKNYSPWPSHLNSLIGLMNWDIWSEIKKTRPDGIVVMGWMNPTWWLAVLASIRFQIPYLLMTDANVHTERSMPKVKRWVRKLVLGRLYFRYAAGFLCSGFRNRELYRLYDVPKEKLFPFAYSWGYGSLFVSARELIPQKTQLREELGIPQDGFVILFCGRLRKEKNLIQLLNAYHRLERPHKALIFVGDGNLKKSLMDHVGSSHIDSVFFPGFQRRDEIAKYYAISDVLVLPSERETWGMVVNEGMCFGLPVVVSDAVGASDDMVINGQNGFCYNSSDTDGLFHSIKQIAEMDEEQRMAMGRKSHQLIQDWLNRDLGLILAQCLDHAYTSRRC